MGVKLDGSFIGENMFLVEVGKRREEFCMVINFIFLISCDCVIWYCEKVSDVLFMVLDGKLFFVVFMWL